MSIARQAEDEPDYLKELLAQAGIDAQASTVAAKLQEVVDGEQPRRGHQNDSRSPSCVGSGARPSGPRAMDWRRVSDLDRRCREGLPI